VKSAPFEYVRAASVEEACALLAQHGEGAKLVAGGQSLVPMMAFRLVRPGWLVDFNEIRALKVVGIENNAARMGACVRQCVMERDDALAAFEHARDAQLKRGFHIMFSQGSESPYAVG